MASASRLIRPTVVLVGDLNGLPVCRRFRFTGSAGVPDPTRSRLIVDRQSGCRIALEVGAGAQAVCQMIDLRHLRYAVLTAEMSSFSRAAQKLNMKQSTLSKRVVLLEQQLGISLFERTTRGAIPTETGRTFLSVAKRILHDVDNLRTTARAVNYGEAGRITIGFSSSLASGNLKGLIGDFLNRFTDVQLDAVEGGADRLIDQIEGRSIDLALLAEKPPNKSIRHRSLWTERLLVALYDDHALLDSEQLHWSDLRRDVFVLPAGSRGAAIANILTARLTEQGCRPNIITQEVSHPNILSMVSAGKFVTLIAESAISGPLSGVHFREIQEGSGAARVEISAVWSNSNQNPALQSFFRLVDERYPAVPAD